MAAACRSCEREIIWATTAAGKAMPLDASPTEAGTWVVVRGQARRATDEDARLHRPRYTPHWATCPDAADWRQR